MKNVLKKIRYAGVKATVGFGLYLILASSLAANPSHPQRARFIRDFSKVSNVIQDRDGFVWIASGYQLIRYDGTTFYPFSFLEKDLWSPDAQIVDMVQDKTGNIWVATHGSGLFEFSTQEQVWTIPNTVETKEGKTVSKNLSCLYADSDENLWVGSVDGGLYRYNISSQECVQIPLPKDATCIAPDHIMDICQSKQGIILVATWGGGVFVVKPQNGQAEPFLIKKDDRDVCLREYFTCIFAEEKTLWLGTRLNGVLGIDLKTKQRSQYLGDKSRHSDWTRNYVTFLHRNRDGSLWVGTGGGGLFQMHESEDGLLPVSILVENNRFVNDKKLTTIMEDNSGGRWLVSSPGGIMRIDPCSGFFKNYFFDHSGCEDLRVPVYTILEDRDGDIWLGSDGEGLIRFNRQTGVKAQYKTDPTLPQGINSNYINALFQDENGLIYIGCHQGGLNVLDPQSGQFKSWKHDDGDPHSISGNLLTSILKDSTGRYWIGTWGKGLNRFFPESGTFQRFQTDPAISVTLSAESVTFLFEDSENNIWLGLNNGLSRMENGSEVRFERFQGENMQLFDAMTVVIHEGRNGDIWLGTRDRGLFRIRRGESFVSHILKEPDLPGKDVIGILEDDKGLLWISTDNGLCRYNPISGRINYFNTLDGLSNNDFSHGFLRCRDGEFLLGNQNGLIGFRDNALPESGRDQKVIVSEVKRLSRPPSTPALSNVKRMTFLYSDTFSVSFSTLSYVNPLKIRYRYRLDGGDNDGWVNLGKLNQIVLSHLKPGRHRLIVGAAESSNRWFSENAVLELYIKPPFWQTWWFLSFISLLLIVGGFLAYRRHIGTITRRIETEVQFNAYCDKKKLTKREREVLKLVLAGKSNQEIEDVLYLSMGTIKVYVHNLYRKLGAKNRIDLINAFNRPQKKIK